MRGLKSAGTEGHVSGRAPRGGRRLEYEGLIEVPLQRGGGGQEAGGKEGRSRQRAGREGRGDRARAPQGWGSRNREVFADLRLWRDAEEGAPPSGAAAPEPGRSGPKAPPQPRAHTGAGFPFVARPYSSGRGARAESLRGRTVPAMGAG